MKRIIRGILAVFVAMTMMFSLTSNLSAIEAIPENEQELISRILTYYSQYTKGDHNSDNGWSASKINADIDIQRCLDELKQLNPKLGQAYQNIMDTWFYADTTMPINKDVLPDGLPTDNSLCIVTLGFQLNQETGEMQPELIDRLEVTLKSAQKYPNAYIAVTGGGTSPAAPGKTEGEEMAAWLIDKGISAERIIVENKAPTTVGNATNTFALLKQMPHIKSIAMISSASHIQRAIAIFQTVFQLEAYKTNSEAISILTNASCPVSRKENLIQQVSAVTQATNFCLDSEIKLLPEVKLSTFDSLGLKNIASEYVQGSKIEPQVIANFTTFEGKKFAVDVTNKATIEPIDSNKIGTQILKVMYTYNSNTISVLNDIVINAPIVKPNELTNDKATSVKTSDDIIINQFISLMVLAGAGYMYLTKKEY